MLPKKRAHLTRRNRVVGQATPLVQIVADSRARVNPTDRRQLVAWLLALRVGYWKTSRQGRRGATVVERARRASQIEWARLMCQCIDTVIRSLRQTIDLDLYLAGLDAADKLLIEE